MKRAVQEAKIQIAHPDEPTQAERLAIGKAAAAVYVISVSADTPKEGGLGIYIAVHGDDLVSGKSYFDQTTQTTTGGPTIDGISNNALMSGANTLVAHLLQGPLGDYARTAPPPELLPPAVNPNPQDKPETPPAIETEAAPEAIAKEVSGRAESLLRNGEVNAAINLLRKNINRVPFDTHLRILLTRAYLAAHRGNEAAAEAQRALTLTAGNDRAAQAELTRLLAEGFEQSGDKTAARSAYEQIIAAQPDAQWARIALANLLLSQDRREDAEVLFRDVRKADPSNPDAALGLARLRADKDDYAGAQQELASTGGVGSRAAFETMTAFFDERAVRLARTLAENRAAWEGKTLSREALYNAAKAQNNRVNGLLSLLKAVPPPATGVTDAAARAYKRRLYAGSLLTQAVADFLNFLETGDADAGAQSALQLGEFQKEMAQIRL